MKSIGKYNILRELGRGAMGIVYEGVDPYIGRKVAIKTIRFDVLTAPAEQQEAQQRFMREARSAGNLSHPSIVTIYEVGEHEGMSFIAMEFIEGESLEAMIAARRKLPIGSVVELIAQLGDALDYAHRNGVVHRDIKPANILVDSEGRPKIVDFGIARIASSSLTQTNTVLGTPSYMAPEQIAGQKVDHRADLFALGAILYELLTLQRAFPGDNVTTVIYRIMNETPPPPRTIDQSLSPGLDVVLGAALAKDPAERYQSGRALADHLRNYQQFEGGADEVTMQATPRPEMPPPVAAVEEPLATMRAMPAAPPAMPDVWAPQATARTMPATAVPPPRPAPPNVAPSGGRRTIVIAVVGAMMVLLVIAVVVGVMMSRAGEHYIGSDANAAGGAAAPDAAAAAVPAPAPLSTPPTTAPGAPSQAGAIDPGAKPSSSPAAPLAANVTPAPSKAVAPAAPRPASPIRSPARQTAPTALADAKALTQPPDRAIAPSVPIGRIYDPTDVDERPRVLKQVDPVYPVEAARLKLQDVVVVKALIGPGGHVEDVQILKHGSKDPAFDAAAVKAVRQYTFAPARKKGQPVSCWFNIGVPFQLPR